MAMHKSEELREVIACIFEQLQNLGFEAPACSLIIYQEDLSAKHWMHIRSANPVENPFTAGRLRATKVNAKRAFARLYLGRTHPLDQPCARKPK